MPFPIDLDSPKTATSIGPLNYDDSPAEITTSQGPTEEIDYGFGPLDPNTTKITDLLRNMNKHQLQHLDEQDEDEVITWLKFRYDALLKAKRSGKKRPHSGSGYGDDERKNKAWMKPGVWMWGPVEDRITGSKGKDRLQLILFCFGTSALTLVCTTRNGRGIQDLDEAAMKRYLRLANVGNILPSKVTGALGMVQIKDGEHNESTMLEFKLNVAHFADFNKEAQGSMDYKNAKKVYDFVFRHIGMGMKTFLAGYEDEVGYRRDFGDALKAVDDKYIAISRKYYQDLEEERRDLRHRTKSLGWKNSEHGAASQAAYRSTLRGRKDDSSAQRFRLKTVHSINDHDYWSERDQREDRDKKGLFGTPLQQRKSGLTTGMRGNELSDYSVTGGAGQKRKAASSPSEDRRSKKTEKLRDNWVASKRVGHGSR